MNHWTPVQYLASVLVLTMVIAFAAAWQFSSTFGPALRRQSARIAAVIAGHLIGIMLMVVRPPVWMIAALGELWYHPLGVQAGAWRKFLHEYCRSLYHMPEHAA